MISVFIDLDETLVRTQFAEDGDSHVSTLRPYAEEFLSRLYKIAPLYILTLGKKLYQTQVIEGHGIQHYFQDIFGREDIIDCINHARPLVPNTKALLVDDLPIGSEGFRRKFMAIGNYPEALHGWDYSSEIDAIRNAFAEQHYILVKCYFADPRYDAGETELLRIYPLVVEKLNRLDLLS